LSLCGKCASQDGTIGCEIKLTGILSTSLLSPDERSSSSHGTMVAPGVNAAAHQHLFSARLDPAVDDDQGGRDLVVAEVTGTGSN
jgi:primary-amine oxidase